MSIVYLRLKSRENKELLEHILEKYENIILSYDSEELGIYPLSNPDVLVEMRDVSKRGGSLSITLPKAVSEYLDLHPGDKILFAIRKRLGKICVDKVQSIYIKSSKPIQ